MSTERNIVNKLFESRRVNESSIVINGKTYSCAFGRYTCDGEPITRDEYFRATRKDTPSSTSQQKRAEEPSSREYTPDEITDELMEIESEIEYSEMSAKRIKAVQKQLNDMEEYMTDEQYETAEKLRSNLWDMEDSSSDEDYPTDPYQERGISRKDFI